MPRSGGGNSGGRRGGSNDTGAGVSVGTRDTSGNTSGGDGRTNVTTGGSVDDRSSREQRRGNEPDIAPLTVAEIESISAGQENPDLAKAQLSMLNATNPAAARSVQMAMDSRRGIAGQVAFAGVGEGFHEQRAMSGMKEMGFDSFDIKGSFGVRDVAGLANEVASFAGATVGQAALGAISNPMSGLVRFAARGAGRLGAIGAGNMSEEARAAGPSSKSGRSISGGGSAITGGIEPTGDESVTGVQSVDSVASGNSPVSQRSKTSVDLRRRTKPASFLSGSFDLGTQSLTG